MSDVIYVLTNEAMPGLVKIGKTNGSVEARIKELSSSTSVPLAFECHFAAEVEDCSDIEKKLHKLFAADRVHPKREFFKVEPERVVLAISIGTYTEVTPRKDEEDNEEQRIIDKVKSKRSNIKLDALKITKGSL